MTTSPQHEIDVLRREIREHDRRYYVEAGPTISDQDYDRLMDRLKSLEADRPELVTPDSPTQRVGGEPTRGFQTVRHARPMLSIDNTYDVENLRKWAERCFESVDRQVAEINAAIQEVDQRQQALKGNRDPGTAESRRNLHSDREQLMAERETIRARARQEGYPMEGGCLVEPKIDGVAISLRYERGRLVRASTRGDGWQGDDVTQNIRTIRVIPLRLIGTADLSVPEVLEVRGEIFMPTLEFERLNREFLAAGEPAFANPRNATAGTLKQLDPKTVRGRRLQFFAHGRGEVRGGRISRQGQLLEAFARWGIPVNPKALSCRSIDHVWDLIRQFDADRADLTYGVDGVVIKVDRFDLQDRLGTTSRFPRWCIAYKYPAEQVETQLRMVEWQVGKTGKLTPRATMEPVQVAGTIIKHATLHNLGEIRRKDIRIGDRVVIQKAGEIIPQVVRVVRPQRPAGLEPIEPPSRCVACGGEVEIEYDRKRLGEIASWPARQQRENLRAEKGGREPGEIPKPDCLTEQDETGRYCINPECPAQLRERLIHFAGRGQMDIEGLGEKMVMQLADAGLLASFGDIFSLHARRDQILALDRIGPKKADNLFSAIDAAKKGGLVRVLASLGIRHVGTTVSRILAGHYRSMDRLLQVSCQQIQSFRIDGQESGIGPEIAQSLHTFLHSSVGQHVILELRQSDVLLEVAAEEGSRTSQLLAGKTFVVTGKLQHSTRNQIHQVIEQHGGRKTGSVTKATDYLIAGEKAGSKLVKAREFGVTVLSEEEFKRMAEGAG